MRSSATTTNEDIVARTATSEARLQLALDAGAVTGTWVWDVANDRLTGDRRFAAYFALDPDRLEIGVPLAEAVQSIHPEDEPNVSALIGDAMAKGGAYNAQYRVRQRDGSYRWVEASGNVTLDAQGNAISFPGLLVDIDTRKRREIEQAALADLSERLREIDDVKTIVEIASRICGQTLNVGRAGYGVVDLSSDTVEIHADWRQRDAISLVGRHRFRDFGSYVDDLRAGRTVAISDVKVDARTHDQAATFEPIGIRSLLNFPLMYGGRLRGLVFVNDDKPRDWTEADVAFAASVADRTWSAVRNGQLLTRLRDLNDGLERQVASRTADRNQLWSRSRDLLLIAGFDGVIETTNPAWARILGWDEAELIGTSFFDLVHPDDAERTQEAAQAIDRGMEFPSFENRYRHKDGTYRWIDWSAGTGNARIFAAGRDISDAKALRSAEEQLRQSQKMEAVGQLTGGVAHDFNNLLTVISTSVALLRREQTSPEQRVRSIDAISKTVQRAARLTGQLLAFARRQSLKPVTLDVIQNVESVVEMVRTLVGARIDFTTSMEDDCHVKVDPSQFDTALVNLCVNARDAMDGAGKLTISVKRIDGIPPLRSHAAVPGPFVSVEVSDTGTGIPPDAVDRIFEPFFTTKPVGQGTGLGLSQVFGFVKQSGGDISVESVQGKGTTFKLYFPRALAPHSENAVDAAEHPTVPTMQTGRVLIVEDNLEVAAAVDVSLRELGYQTEICHEGQAALNLLSASHADFVAVFSDIVMAGMDGLTMAREIRKQWPALPVILSSGYSHVLAEEADHGFQLLPKPYDVAQLSEVLRRTICSAKFALQANSS